MKMYAQIEKMEAQDDGTIKVWGYASSEAVDSDGEVIKADAIKAALPDYLKFGAVREMHQPLAAGTAIEASVESDGRTYFGAHVIDPVACKKVTAGVYKGFSIGGSVLKRDPDNKKVITALKLVEVSLVDRPANPEAVFTCYKAEVETMTDKEAVAEMARMLDDKELTPQEMVKAAKAAIIPVVQDAPAEEVPPADPAPEAEVVERVKVTGALKKGMSTLANFCALLQQVGWLAVDTEMEAQWEGDNSPLPQQLRDWLATGVMIFETMATEEADELLASIQPPDANGSITDVVAAAASADPVAAEPAADAEVAKAATDSAEAVSDPAHPLATEAVAHPPAVSAEPTPVTKADLGSQEAVEALVKAAVASALAPMSEALEKAQSEITRLKSEPAPGKAFLKAVSIGKEDDVAPTVGSREEQQLNKAMTSDDPLEVMKAVHSRGGFRIFGAPNP